MVLVYPAPCFLVSRSIRSSFSAAGVFSATAIQRKRSKAWFMINIAFLIDRCSLGVVVFVM